MLDVRLTDEMMQAVAQKNNVAITAFVRRNGAVWGLRWFTPSMAASFRGHGTLATASVLAVELWIEGDFAFTATTGTRSLHRRAAGAALELPACRRPADDHRRPFVHAVQTSRTRFVEFPDEQAVQQFVPGLTAIKKLHPKRFVMTAPGNEHDVSRHFAPGADVPRIP